MRVIFALQLDYAQRPHRLFACAVFFVDFPVGLWYTVGAALSPVRNRKGGENDGRGRIFCCLDCGRCSRKLYLQMAESR